MKIGFVGLGKMGLNMVTRLRRGGHEVAAFDVSETARAAAAAVGAEACASVREMVGALAAPRVVWVMVPAGAVTDAVIRDVAACLASGDVVIDGGNSHYHRSVERGKELAASGIRFLDSGTSGGVWGLENGYCLMIGGPREAFDLAVPVFATLAPPDGYLHCGDSGSGHLVKMIHNGIEYGMLQAYGEGFEILSKSPYGLDLPAISRLWLKGSVVRSWLLELLAQAYEQDPKLEKVQGFVADSGEGRWTVQEAIDRDVPATVLAHSLFARFASRDAEAYGMKVIATLRNQFGGHAVKKAE